jgi:hypothetical protein
MANPVYMFQTLPKCLKPDNLNYNAYSLFPNIIPAFIWREKKLRNTMEYINPQYMVFNTEPPNI